MYNAKQYILNELRDLFIHLGVDFVIVEDEEDTYITVSNHAWLQKRRMKITVDDRTKVISIRCETETKTTITTKTTLRVAPQSICMNEDFSDSIREAKAYQQAALSAAEYAAPIARAWQGRIPGDWK